METIKQNSQLLKKLDRNLSNAQDSYGYDVLNCYEVTYLDTKGIPQQAQVKITYPSSSASVIHKKSLRDYLDTFRLVKLISLRDLEKAIQMDLKILLQCHVVVSVFPTEGGSYPYLTIPGLCDLEDVVASKDFSIEVYTKDIEVLKVEPNQKTPLYVKSDSLSCLSKTGVINGDLYISMEGNQYPELVSLLQYIVSYHNETLTEEELVENIYNDLLLKYEPNSLCVCAKYTRKNGIDTNSIRFTDISSAEIGANLLNKDVPNLKTARQ